MINVKRWKNGPALSSSIWRMLPCMCCIIFFCNYLTQQLTTWANILPHLLLKSWIKRLCFQYWKRDPVSKFAFEILKCFLFNKFGRNGVWKLVSPYTNRLKRPFFKLWYFDSYQFHKFRKPQKITSLNLTLTRPSR